MFILEHFKFVCKLKCEQNIKILRNVTHHSLNTFCQKKKMSTETLALQMLNVSDKFK